MRSVSLAIAALTKSTSRIIITVLIALYFSTLARKVLSGSSRLIRPRSCTEKQTQYPKFLAKFSPGCGRVAVIAGTQIPCRTISTQRFFQWLLQAFLLPLRVKTEVCRLSCTRFSISLSRQELLQGGWDVTDNRWPTYDLEHLNVTIRTCSTELKEHVHVYPILRMVLLSKLDEIAILRVPNL